VIVAINAGSHANPCFAGDTVRAWSEVLDTARPRPRCRRHPPAAGGGEGRGEVGALKGEDGKYLPDVLLDLDYWALMPV
jgi:2-methylfumaryl-CoA hydratase